jgi:hypothetical protein
MKKLISFSRDIPFTWQEKMIGYVKQTHERLAHLYPDRREDLQLSYRICMFYTWSPLADTVLRRIGIREDLIGNVLKKITSAEPSFAYELDYKAQTKALAPEMETFRILHRHSDLELGVNAPPIQLVIDTENRRVEFVLDHAYMDGKGAEDVLTNLAYITLLVRLTDLSYPILWALGQTQESLIDKAASLLHLESKPPPLVETLSSAQQAFFKNPDARKKVDHLLHILNPQPFLKTIREPDPTQLPIDQRTTQLIISKTQAADIAKQVGATRPYQIFEPIAHVCLALANEGVPILFRSPRLPDKGKYPFVAYKVVGVPASISGVNLDGDMSLVQTITSARERILGIRQMLKDENMADIAIDAVLDYCLETPERYADTLPVFDALFSFMPGNMGTPPPAIAELLPAFYLNQVEGRLEIGQWFSTNEKGDVLYDPKINVVVCEDKTQYYINISGSTRLISEETLDEIKVITQTILSFLTHQESAQIKDVWNGPLD